MEDTEVKAKMEKLFEDWYETERLALERANPDQRTRTALKSFAQLAYYRGGVDFATKILDI